MQTNTANTIGKREAGNKEESPWQMQDNTSGKQRLKMQIIFSSVAGRVSATPELVDGSLYFRVSSDKADNKNACGGFARRSSWPSSLSDTPAGNVARPISQQHKSGWDGFCLKISLVNAV